MKKLTGLAVLGLVLLAGTVEAGERPLYRRTTFGLPSLGSAVIFGQVPGAPATVPPVQEEYYQGGTVPPVPGYYEEGLQPLPHGYYGGPVGPGADLYPNVRYKDLKNIHPCAVPQVVQIVDPCWDPRNRCDCGPTCVNVQICAPPDCPDVKVKKDGRKVKYDYGKYQVEITSRNGEVVVDYDD